MHLVHICGHGFNELSRMLMRKNVNNEVNKDFSETMYLSGGYLTKFYTC